MPVARYLAARARLVDRALVRYVPPGPSRLRQAMRYSLLGGGKRIRPILTLAAAEAVGAQARIALPCACAIEMIHAYSLVHDDLPAMDDDDVRRGRPTSHRVYGEGLAVLVGDALLTEAFRVLATAQLPPPRRLRIVAEVAAAAGEAGMVGGQALDLAAEGRDVGLAEIRAIHRRKTGSLLSVAVRVGAIAGGAEPTILRRLATYGRHLGLAFQIADDLLDWGSGAQADGRSDRERDKATYPRAIGLARARRAALRERDAALAALRPFAQAAAPLRGIVEYVVARALPTGPGAGPSRCG